MTQITNTPSCATCAFLLPDIFAPSWCTEVHGEIETERRDGKLCGPKGLLWRERKDDD